MSRAIHALGAIALLAVTATAAGAQSSLRLTVAPESRLWLEGGSNVHDWSCAAETMQAAVDVDPAFASVARDAPANPRLLRRVAVKVPVRGIKCGNGQMDKNLHKALGADNAPEVTYVLGTFEVAPDAAVNGFAIRTEGRLTVAGVERAVTMDVKAVRQEDGSVKATGVLPIQMTDYGIKPPTAMLGAMRTKNDVRIHFELLVARPLAAVSRVP